MQIVKFEIKTEEGMFHQSGNECVPSDYTKCDAMQRLIASSEYYSTRKITKNVDFDEILIQFIMNDVYNGEGKGLVDDYIHFKQHHEHELERIGRDLIGSSRFSNCSILRCEFTRRHMHEQSTCSSDPKLCFYRETFDALHF
eukprot:1002729_1